MSKVTDILNEVFDDESYLTCEDLVETGLVDSFEMMEIVEALEDEFDIEISGRDIVPENFANVATIEALVEKYL
ncbi:MAG: phosphopantetheine-binding protein [Lachnospiraceae bacterium]|nr:phosphopantetheine-binding protein [Lachnospiraceae bacterium]